MLVHSPIAYPYRQEHRFLKMQIVIASNGVGIEVSVLVVKGECYDAQHKLDFEHIFNSYMLFSQPFSQNLHVLLYYMLVALQIQNATFKM